MKTEQQQLNDMYARVRQVFPRELLDTFAPQQETLADNAIERVLRKDGPDALTVDRLEGIKELVTQHLWSSGLTAASKSLPASATELDSSDQPSAPAIEDLQNLSVDPALAPMQQTKLSSRDLSAVSSTMKPPPDLRTPEQKLKDKLRLDKEVKSLKGAFKGGVDLKGQKTP
jgi:hypothetical protein